MEDYRPTIRVVAEKIDNPNHDKHLFYCQRVYTYGDEDYLRFVYCHDYKNISKPNKDGKVVRDISTLSKDSDTHFDPNKWNIRISSSEYEPNTGG